MHACDNVYQRPRRGSREGWRATSDLASLIWICLLCGCCTYTFASLYFEVLREEWKRSRRSEEPRGGLEEGEEGEEGG